MNLKNFILISDCEMKMIAGGGVIYSKTSGDDGEGGGCLVRCTTEPTGVPKQVPDCERSTVESVCGGSALEAICGCNNGW